MIFMISSRKGRGGKRGNRRDHRNVKPIPLPQIDVWISLSLYLLFIIV